MYNIVPASAKNKTIGNILDGALGEVVHELGVEIEHIARRGYVAHLAAL